ncbi:hypothetical protein LXL04_020531 [Taraxacum kok-saghyz]
MLLHLEDIHITGMMKEAQTMTPPKQTPIDKQRNQRDRAIALHADRDLESREIDEDTDVDTNNKDMNRIRKRKSEDVGVHSGSGTPYVDKDDLKIEEFNFSEKVKDRLNNLEDYQAFFKCLDIYNTEIITRKELQRLVSDLLGKHPDLMEGFTTFLGRENIDGFLADVMDKSKFFSHTLYFLFLSFSNLQCEDDSFELDMLLESVCSAAKRAKELLNNINNKTISPETPIRIEDYFTGGRLWLIS